MQLLKFKILMMILFFSSSALATFTGKECLNSVFETVVIHKDKRTFGMAKTKLVVSKEKCEIVISHEELKFFKNKWKIDVCREPVHIKSGDKGVEVFKRKGICLEESTSEYCETLSRIEEVIQDDGLIFADGEKEELSTDHGRIYCTFQLIKGYLKNGNVYSRHAAVTSHLTPTPVTPTVETPSKSEPNNEESIPVIIPSESDELSAGESGTF